MKDSCILLTPVRSPEAYVGRFFAGTRPPVRPVSRPLGLRRLVLKELEVALTLHGPF